MALCCKRPGKSINSQSSGVVMDNYWILNGVNYLKGCCNDPTNPIRMADCFIVGILQTNKRARLDFHRLWPALLPCEHERFESLKARYPGIFDYRMEEVIRDDRRMVANIRAIPVWTSGPNGGLRVPIICAQPVVQVLP